MTHLDALATLFDRLATDGTADRYEALYDDVARQVLEAMEVRPGHQLLDVGCGAGWMTRRLGKKAPGAQAVGIDAALDALEYVEDAAAAAASLARVTKEGGRLELVVHRHAGAPQAEAWSAADGVPMHHLDGAGWSAVLEAAGFQVESCGELRDSREDAPFEPTPIAPDAATRDAALRDAGALWIRAVR